MNRTVPKFISGTEILGEEHQFTVPSKQIKTIKDMILWEKSEAYLEYLGFVLAINKAVESHSNSKGSKNCSEQILNLDAMLDEIDLLIDKTPPIDQPQRFGNQAFRVFYSKIEADLINLLQKPLPEELHSAVPEIMAYLLESFGNPTRIDYGTGHEISFIMFLCALFKIGFLKEHDKPATGCKIFVKYLDIVRKLQQNYRMEPAGSHGVWSLDDYQFVPFIWGSSQLIGHKIVEPQNFLAPHVLDDFGHDFMFLSCIKYINTVKTGPFSEHSNQLWNISGVPCWSRVNGGLVKMYKAEVLAKFPVVQHIFFGTIFSLEPAPTNACVRKMKSCLLPDKSVSSLVPEPPKPAEPTPSEPLIQFVTKEEIVSDEIKEVKEDIEVKPEDEKIKVKSEMEVDSKTKLLAMHAPPTLGITSTHTQ